MAIRKPCKDVCGEYAIYRNCWKYGAQAEEDSDEEHVGDEEDDDEGDDGLTTPAMLEQEKIVATATLLV